MSWWRRGETPLHSPGPNHRPTRDTHFNLATKQMAKLAELKTLNAASVTEFHANCSKLGIQWKRLKPPTLAKVK